MVLRFFILACVFLFLSCVTAERDNPNDPGSDNYRGYQVTSPPSSSKSSSSSYVAPPPPPSSSSVAAVLSSSSAVPSSSSVAPPPPSSSSSIPSSSSVGSVPSGGKGNDIANYRTTQIGEQVWMAENLNYYVAGSKCGGDDGKLSDDNTSICDKYGRLYNWATAMNLEASCNSSYCASQVGEKHQGICPSGWHLPSNADWNVLMKFVNPICTDNRNCAGAGTMLKAKDGWNTSSGYIAGTDDYGFSALPGGFGDSYGTFYSVGNLGYWWSASEYYSDLANFWDVRYLYEDVFYDADNKRQLVSVRCVKD